MTQFNSIKQLPGERVVTESDLNNAKKRLEEAVQILKKYKKIEYSPYNETTTANGTCQAINTSADGKISFSSITFSDCADIAVRHALNLLIYSQGKTDHPNEPWANVLPPKDSIEENDLIKKLNEVKNAMKNREKVSTYSLKERLQMFFYTRRKLELMQATKIHVHYGGMPLVT